MIDALIQGKLTAAPQQRTTKTGKPMASARLRVATNDPENTVFASVVAFDPEAVAALLALDAGDAVAVAGPIKVGVWTDNNGNTRPNVDVVADRVLSVYAVRKKRAATDGAANHRPTADGVTNRYPTNERPSQDAWQARQAQPPAHDPHGFDGADDLDF